MVVMWSDAAVTAEEEDDVRFSEQTSSPKTTWLPKR